MKTKLGLGLAALAGLVLLVALVAYHGFTGVMAALFAAGWVGILAASLFHIVPLVFSSLAWRAILNRSWPRSLVLFFWVRMIREAVSNLLPVVQVGAEVVGARVLTFHGLRPAMAGASVVVDLTVEVMTQFAFTVIGVVFIMVGEHDSSVVYWLVAGLAMTLPLLLSFFVAQHLGLFRLLENFIERMAAKWDWAGQLNLNGLHNAIKSMYRDRRGIAESAGCHLGSWVFGAGEIWIALHFMGHEVNFREALIVESLAQAVKSVGFAVPGSLGVQEGGFLLVGNLMGLSPEVSLALSLVKRARDLLLGLPALAAWHFIEGRRLWLRFNETAARQKLRRE